MLIIFIRGVQQRSSSRLPRVMLRSCSSWRSRGAQLDIQDQVWAVLGKGCGSCMISCSCAHTSCIIFNTFAASHLTQVPSCFTMLIIFIRLVEQRSWQRLSMVILRSCGSWWSRGHSWIYRTRMCGFMGWNGCGRCVISCSCARTSCGLLNMFAHNNLLSTLGGGHRTHPRSFQGSC